MTLLILVSIFIGITLAEIGFRTLGSAWLSSNLRDNRAHLQAFRQAIGDDARQAMMIRAGLTTLQFSVKILGILAVMLTIGGIAPLMLEWAETGQTTYLMVTSVVAIFWWMVRRMPDATKPKNTYGLLARWLHWVALEPAVVRHLSFDLERQFALPKRQPVISTFGKASDPADGAVYVCGLARSGTTILLRILDEIDDFRSLTYRDMPFVLAPNLWRRIAMFAPQQAASVERAHGDGIRVDFDSPESFEEVFWRTFGTATADHGCLGAKEPSADVLAAFADYRALVANPRTEHETSNGIQRRYLSKNNNNLLRLHSLCADPTATVLVVYRDPIATARSLHRQHQRFCAAQANDRFTRTYMSWLGHHEFGVDHRPFCFAVHAMNATLKPENLNYWLDYWTAVYRHVLTQTHVQVHLLNHDALRAEPTKALAAIFAVLGIQTNTTELAKQVKSPILEVESSDGFSRELLRRAEDTYCDLLASTNNILSSIDSVGQK